MNEFQAVLIFHLHWTVVSDVGVHILKVLPNLFPPIPGSLVPLEDFSAYSTDRLGLEGTGMGGQVLLERVGASEALATDGAVQRVTSVYLHVRV